MSAGLWIVVAGVLLAALSGFAAWRIHKPEEKRQQRLGAVRFPESWNSPGPIGRRTPWPSAKPDDENHGDC
jgi:hypothetical protein